jgi:hypothetical protein
MNNEVEFTTTDAYLNFIFIHKSVPGKLGLILAHKGICPALREACSNSTNTLNTVTKEDMQWKIANYQCSKCTKRRWSNPTFILKIDSTKGLSKENHPTIENDTTNQTNDTNSEDYNPTVKNSDHKSNLQNHQSTISHDLKKSSETEHLITQAKFFLESRSVPGKPGPIIAHMLTCPALREAYPQSTNPLNSYEHQMKQGEVECYQLLKCTNKKWLNPAVRTLKDLKQNISKAEILNPQSLSDANQNIINPK